MKTQKCCAHCPGKLIVSASNETHDCCQPRYVTGKLRVSGLEKQVFPCKKKEKKDLTRVDRAIQLSNVPSSCYDKFALAKRLHAENLEHQPLPDKVDDSVFKNVKADSEFCRRVSRGKCHCLGSHKHETEDIDKKRTDRYGPVLGCKKPETRMDLAICWETPINPVYEPKRSAHIDGSDSGVAPAIFALVHHAPNPSRVSVRATTANQKDLHKKRHCYECRCSRQVTSAEAKNCDFPEFEFEEKKIGTGTEKECQGGVCCCSCCCYDCVCKDLKSVSISKGENQGSRSGKTFRKCEACADSKSGRSQDPRLIKSAVGYALGLDKSEKTHRRDGLPGRITVPRPRTPFARRSFCIDTLAPPFSVVRGCRDADYPEHWRLMTIYQQSFKNPAQKRRAPYY